VPFLGGEGRNTPIRSILPLADGDSPEIRLQSVLSLGGLGNAAVEEHLADLTRRHLDQPYLSDALLSGLAHREADLLARLARRQDWPTSDPAANRILSGLAGATLGAREIEEVKTVLALAATAFETGGKSRALALLQGLVPSVGGSKRPLLLEAAPERWDEFSRDPTTAKTTRDLLNTLVWPGKEGVTVVTEPPRLTESQQTLFQTGATLYAAVCAACHQVDGKGLEGLAPPLLDSEWVLGPSDRPVKIVLHGVRGPIQVLGKTHTGDMPPLGILPDEQIAAILTYVRRAWGHTASPVEIGEVTRIRAQTAHHSDAWSPEELRLAK